MKLFVISILVWGTAVAIPNGGSGKSMENRRRFDQGAMGAEEIQPKKKNDWSAAFYEGELKQG